MTSASTWEPGDPLHFHPWFGGDSNAQCVRHIIDLHDDAEHVWEWLRRGHAHCGRCQVAWRAYSPAGAVLTCWMCGGEGQPPEDA
jgi:hypothetical protein